LGYIDFICLIGYLLYLLLDLYAWFMHIGLFTTLCIERELEKVTTPSGAVIR